MFRSVSSEIERERKMISQLSENCEAEEMEITKD